MNQHSQGPDQELDQSEPLRIPSGSRQRASASEERPPVTALAERDKSQTAPGVGPVVTAIVILWLAGVVVAHYAGLLRTPPGSPPIPIFIAVTFPIAIFFAAYRAIPRFQAAVLGVDIGLVTSFQAWRVAGFVFLPLLVFGHLPGLFAWPAGLGDVAVGLAAPLVAWRVVRDASFATTGAFATFHWLGILDASVALGTFALASGLIPGLTNPTTVAMAEMPLSLIPGFLVPAFLILHAVALLKARALRWGAVVAS